MPLKRSLSFLNNVLGWVGAEGGLIDYDASVKI